MKTLISIFLILGVSITGLSAQEKETVRALISIKGEFTFAWIVDGNSQELKFTDKENSTIYKNVRISGLDSIYFMEPADYAVAMELYRSHKYLEARTKFAETAEKYKWLEEIPGNYHTLAVFYQMECYRQLGELDALKALSENFVPEPLLRETDRQQVEVYKYWEAVRAKSWPRLIEIANSEIEKHYPGSLRAQIGYCLGLAYEAINEPRKALNAFNEGFVSDFAASKVVVRNSALASLRMLKNNEDVQLAMKLFGTKDESPNSEGAKLLKEAVAITKLWDLALGGGEKLPDEYKTFLAYESKAAQ